MYKINKLQHGKHFVRDFHTRWFCIRNLTHSLRSLVWFQIPYLPVYNARPCIIRTLTFDHLILKKKKFQDKHQELKLPCFHLINKSWEFINDMFTCLLTYLLKLQISHAPSTYLHAFLFNKSETFYKSCNLKSLLPSILKLIKFNNSNS